jgi:hypothetical protein
LNYNSYSQIGDQKIDTNYLKFTTLNPTATSTGLLFTTAESKYIYSFLLKHNQIKKNNVYLWSLYEESKSSSHKKTLIIEQDSIQKIKLEQNYMLVTEKNNFLQKEIKRKNFIITASLIGVGALTTILTIQTIRK